MRFHTICALVVLTGGLWSTTARSSQLEERDLADVLNRVQSVLQEERALGTGSIHGLRIDTSDPDAGEVLILETDVPDPTLQRRLTEIVRDVLEERAAWRDWLRRNEVRVIVVRELQRPDEPSRREIAGLLRRVQDRVELDPDLSGALVLNATVSEAAEGDRWIMRVRGKVAGDDQLQLLLAQFEEIMGDKAEWAHVAVELDHVALVAPSAEFAQQYYTMGLQSFWSGDYVNADFEFMRALAEAPQTATLMYWRVLCALALDERVRAEEKLRPLLQANPRGSLSPTIAEELWRVQGPLRSRLMEAEKRVLHDLLPLVSAAGSPRRG